MDEAIALLAESGPDARPLAGGTDLLVRMKRGLMAPRLLVDLAGLPELRGIEMTPQGLRIGSMVTHAEVVSSPLVREHVPVLASACGAIGAVQTRSLGTLGGNLVSCVPSLDGGPPLLVLDAMVTVVGPQGRRQMPLPELFRGPHRSTLLPGELLQEIVIPKASLGMGACFAKFGRRKGLSLAVVNVAAAVMLAGDGRRIERAAIALGAVAPTAIRVRRAEAFLAGGPADPEALAEAARIAAEEISPIDDFRASADYRRRLATVLTRRVLEGAIASAQARRGGM